MAAADDRLEDCLLDVRGARSVLVWSGSCRAGGQCVRQRDQRDSRGSRRTNCVRSRQGRSPGTIRRV